MVQLIRVVQTCSLNGNAERSVTTSYTPEECTLAKAEQTLTCVTYLTLDANWPGISNSVSWRFLVADNKSPKRPVRAFSNIMVFHSIFDALMRGKCPPSECCWHLRLAVLVPADLGSSPDCLSHAFCIESCSGGGWPAQDPSRHTRSGWNDYSMALLPT